MGLRWEAASSLPGLAFGYRPDGLQVGRVRHVTTGAAWEGHYDPAGLERSAGLALRGESVDDEPFLVARGVRLWEAKQAVERRHELFIEAAELAERQADAEPPPDP